MSTGPAFPLPRLRGRDSGPQTGPLFSGLGRGRAGAVLVTLRGVLNPASQENLLGESVRVVLAHSEPQRADPVGARVAGEGEGECLRGPSGWEEPFAFEDSLCDLERRRPHLPDPIALLIKPG